MECLGRLRTTFVRPALCKALQTHGIQGRLKTAVLEAINRAPEDDPILVIFWDDQALGTRNAEAGETRAALVHMMVTVAAPGCTPSPAAPDEVFNLSTLADVEAIRVEMHKQPYLWALGDLVGVLDRGRNPVGRAVMITELKKKVPFIYAWSLFL